jgi:hypothetical protein
MPKFARPHLDGHRVLYKGKRYWVIEVDADHPFEGIDASCAEFVVYDLLARGVVATATKMAKGRYACSLMSHVALTYSVDSVRDMVMTSAKEMNRYMKAIS